MGVIDRNAVLKGAVEVLSVQEYCDKYGEGVTPQGVYYAMENGMVDYVQFGGREKYIVMTPTTKAYKPNASPQRNPVHRSTIELAG